jgi:predicted tellurium resistance membrane protein TerC
MILTIFSIILINLFLSIDNIIPIILLADTLPNKKKRTAALLIGLFGGAVMRIFLLFFASLLFGLGTIIYVAAGIFLIYLGIKGLLKTGEDEETNKRSTTNFYAVILYIMLIDISLSIDNIAALVAITRQLAYLAIGVILSVAILFGLSFSINAIIQRFKGLDIAAYIAIVFLGVKFLIFPLGINISSELTSAVIIFICLVCVVYFFLQKTREEQASVSATFADLTRKKDD